jgi:hypothetical protein
MHVLVIIEPNNIQKDGKPLAYREWITDATDAACAIKMHKELGRKVERYSSEKHDPYLKD